MFKDWFPNYSREERIKEKETNQHPVRHFELSKEVKQRGSERYKISMNHRNEWRSKETHLNYHKDEPGAM